MANQELVEYIKKRRESGATDKEIWQSLLDAGWQERDIEENFRNKDIKYRIVKSARFWLTILVLIGASAGAFFIYNKLPTENHFPAIFPADVKYPEAILFSPDGTQYAYQLYENGYKNSSVFINGVKQKTYDTTSSVTFSPDSKHFAYEAHKGGKRFTILDGQEVETTGQIPGEMHDFIFSPDSQRMAYVVSHTEADKMFYSVIVDGKEGKRYVYVTNLVFSPDSKRLAYVAETKEEYDSDGIQTLRKEIVVLDDKESKEYDSVGAIRFTPNSQQIVFMGFKNNDAVLVIGDQESGSFDGIANIIFSPKGDRLAYISYDRKANKHSVVINDGAGGKISDKKYWEILNLIFSPDGQRIAYQAGDGDVGNIKRFVVIDGERGKDYAGAIQLVFSPDSKHLAYVAIQSDGQFVVQDDRIVGQLYDNAAAPHWKDTRSLVFSPNSKNIAYIAPKQQKFAVVVNEKEGEFFDYIWEPVRFSADNKSLNFNALAGNKIKLVTQEVK